MGGKEGIPKSLELDPDLLELLKRAVIVSYDSDDDEKDSNIRLLSKATKKWKTHERIFKK